MSHWTVEDARQTYNIAHWGEGYFDVGGQGQVVVRPDRGRSDACIDLHALAGDLRRRGMSLPVLVRFTDILHDRVDTLCDAFAWAMEQHDYHAGYTAVYPIKVNQQRSVVGEIIAHGGRRVGLEAGSKPELLAVLALAGSDGGIVVCNGYKDREYIRLALMGRLLGKQVYIVVEKLSELDHVIAASRELDIAPLIGVRIRLASIGKGKWQNTGGEKSKFGFSAGELLRLVQRLREAGLVDALRMMHVHLGSQIANIRDIQPAMREAARYYAELHRLGVPLRCVDVGGGLGVDYEGTRSRSFCSMNYTVREYANNVVHALWEICQEQGLPQPHILSESGRAMTAHHAVLVTNVIEVEQPPGVQSDLSVDEGAPQVLKDLAQALDGVSPRSAIECYHDAGHWLALSQDMYIHGMLTIEQRAQAESLYYAICRAVYRLLQPGARLHREVLDELNQKLADKYFCNFSLFQSLPDVWAIDQIFPIMPLHRLDQRPGRRALIKDITCDSDGRIDAYVDQAGIESTLPLHLPAAGEDYLLGFFLVGAYQEILGDMHNLFGDTHAVNVALAPGGSGYRINEIQEGDTVDGMLRYVHYDSEQLMEIFRRKITEAQLEERHRALCLETLSAGLAGYTYYLSG